LENEFGFIRLLMSGVTAMLTEVTNAAQQLAAWNSGGFPALPFDL